MYYAGLFKANRMAFFGWSLMRLGFYGVLYVYE